MPTIQRVFTLEVTPEKFIDNCSSADLQITIMLAEKKLQRINPDVQEVTDEIVKMPNPLPERPTPPELPLLPPPPVLTVPQKPQKKGKQSKSWTEYEVELLKQLYHTTPLADISAKFGRPGNAIMQKAAKLSLRKYKERKKTPVHEVERVPPNPQPPGRTHHTDAMGGECRLGSRWKNNKQ